MIVVLIHSVQKNSQTCWWTISNFPLPPRDCKDKVLTPFFGYTFLACLKLSFTSRC